MKKIILWIKKEMSRLTRVNKTPDMESFEIDIMKELDFKDDECKEMNINNFKWEL